jgi:replicative DNA helicase
MTDEELRRHLVHGGSFCLDVAPGVPAVWGAGTKVVWASGEPLLVVGPDGCGKTTVAQQVMLGMVGLRDEVLGLSVAPTYPLLYIAIDRPKQAQRSMARMVTEEDRKTLDNRLVVWKGMLLSQINRQPRLISELAKRLKAKAVILDGLKDAASRLSDDEAGASIAMCFKYVIDEGIEIAALFHQRKGGGDDESKIPNTLDAVYGSRLITAACGSVVMLWGDPGSEVVAWRQLKQPAEVVGPFNVIHDHEAGTSVAEGWVDLMAMAGMNGGITAVEAAIAMYGTTEPTKSQRDTAYRRLERLVKNSKLMKAEIDDGKAGRKQIRYRPYEVVWGES